MARSSAGFVLALCLALVTSGCGSPAAPLPPSLNLPTPVLDLSAVRFGKTVKLAWTMSRRTTDKLLMRSPIPVQICRGLQDGPCTAVATLHLAPGSAASYSDELPEGLLQGPDRVLRYEVELRNRAGKSAAPSNTAYSAAGVSPPICGEFAAKVQANGVLLSWQAESQPGRSMMYRIERLQVFPTTREPQPASALAPPIAPSLQTLAVRVHDGADPGHALDTSAQFDRQYRYTIQRIASPALAVDGIAIEGPPSEGILVTTTDRFPPVVPQGLAAVADETAPAIDLSWTPNSENDLAAYHVYRRDLQAGGPMQRIADVHVDTSFRDTSVQSGHRYAYSVSASDQDNNESQPSSPVEEEIPAK